MWFFRTPLETLKTEAEQSAARAAKITAVHAKEMRCSLRCASLCEVKREAVLSSKRTRIEYLKALLRERENR